MVHDELLSFRTDFWPSHYPIEARYYEYSTSGSSLVLRTRLIATPEELRVFQKELTRRECLFEWSFLAYYDPLVPQHDGRYTGELVTATNACKTSSIYRSS